MDLQEIISFGESSSLFVVTTTSLYNGESSGNCCLSFNEPFLIGIDSRSPPIHFHSVHQYSICTFYQNRASEQKNAIAFYAFLHESIASCFYARSICPHLGIWRWLIRMFWLLLVLLTAHFGSITGDALINWHDLCPFYILFKLNYNLCKHKHILLSSAHLLCSLSTNHTLQFQKVILWEQGCARESGLLCSTSFVKFKAQKIDNFSIVQRILWKSVKDNMESTTNIVSKRGWVFGFYARLKKVYLLKKCNLSVYSMKLDLPWKNCALDLVMAGPEAYLNKERQRWHRF